MASVTIDGDGLCGLNPTVVASDVDGGVAPDVDAGVRRYLASNSLSNI